MNKVIDVIIPSYNAEVTILNAICSIPIRKELNIIIVDDGSTDNTRDIVSKYIKSGNVNDIIYYHQDNKGEAEARNSGLKLSFAKYVIFLDSDDELILSDSDFDVLLNVLNEKNYAIVMGGYKKNLSNGKVKSYNYKNKSIGIKDLNKKFLSRTINPGIGNAFCKNEIIKTNNICFSSFSYGADNDFVRSYLAYSCKDNTGAIIYNKSFFCYKYNDKSIMNSTFSEKRLDSIRSVIKTKELYTELNLSCPKEINIFLLNEIRGVYSQSFLSKSDFNNELILKYIPSDINIMSLITFNRFFWSLANFIFYISPSLYGLFLKFYKEIK